MKCSNNKKLPIDVFHTENDSNNVQMAGGENCVYTHEEAICEIRQSSICHPGHYSLRRSNVGDFHPNHLEGYVSFWHE